MRKENEMDFNYVIRHRRTKKLLSKFSGCFDSIHTDCAFMFSENGARNFISNHGAEKVWKMEKVS